MLKINRKKKEIEEKSIYTLFTIGYEKISIDYYLNKLVDKNIKTLVDVRKNPISMKYGFSKSQLKNFCVKLKMKYLHIPELGINSDKRQKLNSEYDYKKLFTNYKETLVNKTKYLDEVLSIYNNDKRIAITCFEKEHESCHRNYIAESLEKKHSIYVEHL